MAFKFFLRPFRQRGNSNDVPTTFNFSINVTDNESISSVKIDLTSIGGPSDLVLSKSIGNKYIGSYATSKSSIEGNKLVIFTITDNRGNTKELVRYIDLIGQKDYLDIFTDASSQVCNTCTWAAKGELALQYDKGAIEGVEDYVFDFTTEGSYAGFGLNLSGWSNTNTKDYSIYDTFISFLSRSNR